MTMQIDAKVLRALAGLANDPDDVGLHNPTTRIHLRPLDDESGSVAEVCDGRAYVRVEVPETCDEPVLLDRDTARMPLAEQTVSIDGAQMGVHGFAKVLERPGQPGVIAYPDCEPLRPDSAARVAFAINPKVLAAVSTAIQRLGVRSVEVLLPVQRGGPIGMRGEQKNGRFVEATILSESLFGSSVEDVDEPGPDPRGLPGPKGLPGGGAPRALPAAAVATVICGDAARHVWRSADGKAELYVCDEHREVGRRAGWRRSRYASLSADLAATCQHEMPAGLPAPESAA